MGDEVLFRYYRTVSEAVEIGIAMWSHPDSGYLMSTDLCARIADLPNIVAIKYSVPREMYAELTRLAGDRLLVGTASEDAWLDNILELGWRLYLCSYGGGAVSAIRQFRSAGIDVPIGSGDSMDGDYWAEAVPGLSDHYASPFGSIWGDDPRPEVNAFFERYAAKHGGPAETSFPLNGYSAVQMIKIAAERAGSLESDAVLAELNKFDSEPLLWGETSYTPDTHIDLGHVLTIVQIQDGKGSHAGKGGPENPPPLRLIFEDFTEDLYGS